MNTSAPHGNTTKDMVREQEPLSLPLNLLKKGQSGVVRAVASTNNALRSKLLSMGVVSGTPVKILGVAPLGDPINIQALGYILSLRRSEAASVQVSPA